MPNIPNTNEDLFFSCLSPGDLYRYSLTQKSAYSQVKSYRSRAFKISSRLSRFFTPEEIILFRYCQSNTGMLISGSTALQFFDRSEYEESDLDLYVEHRYAALIGKWLQRIGYTFVAREQHQSSAFDGAHSDTPSGNHVDQGIFSSSLEGYFGRGVAGVFNFHKFFPDRKIQLITSLYSPLEVILHFHSTCVMNIISHNTAYAFYPLATFEQRRSLICATEGSKQDIARRKYISRGWTMEPALARWELLDRYSDFRCGNRWVGDSSCWTIEILPKMDFACDFVNSNTWEHTYSDELEARMDFMILHTPTLRYSYIIADDDVVQFLLNAFSIKCTEGRYFDSDINKLIGAYCTGSTKFHTRL
ncbi:hypothetical protein BDZ94DRAFT_1276577 [Collybia nuda]|uniref:Uncharacterized protein n=1 Tax=Collybia nuda TaxID=64659 RepID=A0A9P5XUR0_9AGAR|nr:hypothetical protein BDZ94DRAFT_1276577 [Collybia nuda]